MRLTLTCIISSGDLLLEACQVSTDEVSSLLPAPATRWGGQMVTGCELKAILPGEHSAVSVLLSTAAEQGSSDESELLRAQKGPDSPAAGWSMCPLLACAFRGLLGRKKASSPGGWTNICSQERGAAVKVLHGLPG